MVTANVNRALTLTQRDPTDQERLGWRDEWHRDRITTIVLVKFSEPSKKEHHDHHVAKHHEKDEHHHEDHDESEHDLEDDGELPTVCQPKRLQTVSLPQGKEIFRSEL